MSQPKEEVPKLIAITTPFRTYDTFTNSQSNFGFRKNDEENERKVKYNNYKKEEEGKERKEKKKNETGKGKRKKETSFI